jgi:putative glycosyltransferase
MQESDADVVHGIQEKRKGKFYERISGGIFWSVFSLISNYPTPKNQLVAKIMSRRYLDSRLEYREREIFSPGLWALMSFNKSEFWSKNFLR